LLFIIMLAMFLGWDIAEDEFGYARNKEESDTKSKPETTRKL